MAPDPVGDGLVGSGMMPVRLARHHRLAAVRGGADVDMQRHLAKEVDAELVRFLMRAAMAEDFGAVAALMGVAGGAVTPLLYGILSDRYSPQLAYWVLAPCYAFVLLFAVTTKPYSATGGRRR